MDGLTHFVFGDIGGYLAYAEIWAIGIDFVVQECPLDIAQTQLQFHQDR